MKNINKIGYVYMITSPNGRMYVGSTNNINNRWKSYKWKSSIKQPKLLRSINKYGYENHIFEILWSGEALDMFKYEHLIGVYYEVITKGLNCRLPNYDDVKCIISDESKLKMSVAKLGIKSNMLNKKHSNETKDKMSKSQKLRIYSEEQIDKLKKMFIGRKLSDETKLKISLSKKGIKHKT